MPALRLALIPTAATALLFASLVSPAPAAAATPVVGECFDYPATTIGKASSAAPAIPCEAPHTAETWWIGTVPDSFGIPSKSTPKERLAAARPCSTAGMNDHLGMPNRRLPSRYVTLPLFPTDGQWSAGERWVRCDVVLKAGRQISRTTGTAAAFVARVGQERLNFCTLGTPRANSAAAFLCTKPQKNWIKVLDQELGGPNSSFPGTASVERQTRRLCERMGERYNGKIEFPGWWGIWPTSVGWKEGRRSAQCFVPLYQYKQELAERA